MAGRITSARASATRCRCPPDSCNGRRSPRPRNCTRSSASATRCAIRLARHTTHAQAEADILRHRHVREQRIVLEHQAEIATERRQRLHRPALQPDAAGVGRDESGDHVQRRRLAAAAGAEQRDELARRHVRSIASTAVSAPKRLVSAQSCSAGSAIAGFLVEEIADADEAAEQRDQRQRDQHRDDGDRGQRRREAEFEERRGSSRSAAVRRVARRTATGSRRRSCGRRRRSCRRTCPARRAAA